MSRYDFVRTFWASCWDEAVSAVTSPEWKPELRGDTSVEECRKKVRGILSKVFPIPPEEPLAAREVKIGGGYRIFRDSEAIERVYKVLGKDKHEDFWNWVHRTCLRSTSAALSIVASGDLLTVQAAVSRYLQVVPTLVLGLLAFRTADHFDVDEEDCDLIDIVFGAIRDNGGRIERSKIADEGDWCRIVFLLENMNKALAGTCVRHDDHTWVVSGV